MTRWLAAAGVTVAVNLLLLMMMAKLVSGGSAADRRVIETLPVDLVQLRREPPPLPEPYRPNPPPALPEQEPPPPPPELQRPAAPRISSRPLEIPAMKMPLRLSDGPFIGVPAPEIPATPTLHLDTDATPLVRVNPRYPRRARLARIEGKVVVELTIERDGSVSDPKIVEARPGGVFDSAVLRAVRMWKFAPKVVNGAPVARRAVQTIRFALKDG